MTCRSITAVLGSLLVGLLLVVSVPAVSAALPCEGTGYALEHCEAIAIASDVTLFAAGGAVTPVHILSVSGLGQEQFDATEDNGDAIFLVTVPTSETIAHMESDSAPENYQQMLATRASN